jgi:predicted nucleic acid-binding protein
MTLAVVVDASVAIKWFVAESDSDVADRLLERQVELHAPLLLMSEFANGLWKNFRKELIDSAQAEAALRGIRRTIAHWHATEPMLGYALGLSLRLDHPVYDFLYVALAERNGVQCVTADLRLLRKIRATEHAERVIHLSDWRPE